MRLLEWLMFTPFQGRCKISLCCVCALLHLKTTFTVKICAVCDSDIYLCLVGLGFSLALLACEPLNERFWTFTELLNSFYSLVLLSLSITFFNPLLLLVDTQLWITSTLKFNNHYKAFDIKIPLSCLSCPNFSPKRKLVKFPLNARILDTSYPVQKRLWVKNEVMDFQCSNYLY